METKSKPQVWGGRLSEKPNEANIAFCAGRDVSIIPMADEILLPYDVWTNFAHTAMLEKIGVLTSHELEQIHQSLRSLLKKLAEKTFSLDPAKEDVHINVEDYVTHESQVEAGKKMHTGRSRNDQVTTDMRLFLRDQIIAFAENLAILIGAILDRAEKELLTVMPGFTHYQPAMLTTLGHWMTHWSQGLLRDLERFLQDLNRMNYSPLGAAASFGTSWAIDREMTATLLAFDGVEENSLDCISSRWEHEAQIASSISITMNHLGVIAQDLILLSHPYYDMLRIDDAYVTGSSIMPQKRNPDFAEIIRAKSAMSQGILLSLLGIQKGAMSGYNRDSQPTKYLIMDIFRECGDAGLVLSGVINTLKINRERMRQQTAVGFMNAADVADWLARTHGLSFRDCYRTLSHAVKYSEKTGVLTLAAMQKALAENNLDIILTQNELDFLNDPESLLREKQHTGAPGPSSVEKMVQSQRKKLKDLTEQFSRIKTKTEKAQNYFFRNDV